MVKVGDYILDIITSDGKDKDIGIVCDIVMETDNEKEYYGKNKVWAIWNMDGMKLFLADGMNPPYFKIISKEEALARMI